MMKDEETLQNVWNRLFNSLSSFNETKEKSIDETSNVINSIFPNIADWFKDFDLEKIHENFEKVNNINYESKEEQISIAEDRDEAVSTNSTNSTISVSGNGDITYTYRDDSIANDTLAYSTIIADTLDQYTFIATCTPELKYNFTFTFGDKTFVFDWNSKTLHFDGQYIYNNTTTTDENTKFWYDETSRQFVTYDVKLNEQETGCKCNDEKNVEDCCNKSIHNMNNDCEKNKNTCNVPNEYKNCPSACKDNNTKTIVFDDCKDDSPVCCDKSSVAATLFEELNNERENVIQGLLKNIFEGIMRLIEYKQYIPVRSSDNSPIDIIVFTLEDVQGVCPERINDFWNVIEYTRLSSEIAEHFGFTKVFIFDDVDVEGNSIHPVRCMLK